MPKTVFQSTLPAESELVCAQLAGAGFHPSVIHSQSSGLHLVVGAIPSEVVVPDGELEAARTYLLGSKLSLDETQPSGPIPEGAVCPVHEKPAVALCDRCGTFLCPACGSLGSPPLCEECVVRHEPSRPRPAWVKNTARLWAMVWIGSALLGLLITLLRLRR
ncbi:MAG: B-box zinc finger protein [Myxococcota bacterium]